METHNIKVELPRSAWADEATNDADRLVEMLTGAILSAVGGKLSADTLPQLNASQATLLAYKTLCQEVMDGGFIQLIYNGFGGFVFLNPVAKVLKQWGLKDLSKLLYAGKMLYLKHRAEIERDRTDEEFMAMFEQFADFDDLDDSFVENEEEWTQAVAEYAKEHIGDFATLV